ncbi:unnamed protein product [Mesocestoides corti]|nr:unnamed protein product [Mesocestoides corti]
MSRSITQRSHLKDIYQLYRTIETATDGQASIISVSEMSVVISLHPKSGYNAHAAFTVKITCPVTYPREHPELTFCSPIFHPNIDTFSGRICLNLIDEWLSCYSLLDVVKALLYLINNPNFNEANNRFANLKNPDLFAKKTIRMLAVGEEEDDGKNGEVQAVCVDVGQESDDEHDDVLDVIASAYKEDDNEEIKGDTAVFDDNVLSFANIRFTVASENESQLSPPYESDNICPFFETQRILIWYPANCSNANTPSVFYFFEPLGGNFYWVKFRDLYNTLFNGNVLQSMKTHPESRQTSSLCPWYNFFYHEPLSYQSSTTSSSKLSFFFSKKMLMGPGLTDDFCPWSHVDRGGIWDILSGMFCEERQRLSWTENTSVENSVGSHDTAFHFNTSFEVEDSGKEEEKEEEKEAIKEIAEYRDAETLKQVDANEVEVKEDVEKLESSGKANSLLEDHKTCDFDGSDGVQSNIGEVEFEEVTAHEQVNVHEDTQSSRSSETYKEEDPDWNDLGKGGYSTNKYFWWVEVINMDMRPQWHWFFRQTRWPFRFAPQQNVDVSVHENRIPPWRASVGRLFSDVCNFCEQNPQMRNLILLDPMALSPLSPLLNLLRHSVEPKAHLTGILWMTPIDALSPFYRVPIPRQEEDAEQAVGEHVYPQPGYLRFLTVAAFVSNWFAWFSRVEIYSSMGVSRFSSTAMSDSVAGCVLQPYILGCGQIPLIDLWPLWLARRLPLLPFHLPRLFGKHISRHFFPFTDLDEI